MQAGAAWEKPGAGRAQPRPDLPFCELAPALNYGAARVKEGANIRFVVGAQLLMIWAQL